MSDALRERELKFDVPDDFIVPDLSTLTPENGSIAERELMLESTYFDTDRRDLLAAGLTLRKRTGDADTGWQLKVPDGDARIEVRVEPGGSAAGRGVPLEIRELTRGVRGRAALRPIAVVRTRRRVYSLLDAGGDELAEVVDDNVVSHTQREFGITRSWREVEVELGTGKEKLLGRASKLLSAHGARPATIGSKLLHALDAAALPQADTDRLSGTVSRYLAEQFEALVLGDVQLRRELDVVHPTRVATRRYRSVLKVFAPMLDPDRAAALDDELRWYAAVLGAVRDVQVLRRHLELALDDLPGDLDVAPARASIDAALTTDQSAAREALRAAMDGARYAALLRELRAWREALPLRLDGPASDVADYVQRAERTMTKRLAAARGTDRGDESQHRARKAAKRTRYVAELAMPVIGAKAKRVRSKAKDVQERFGDRQDAVLAAQFLRRHATDGDGFVLGVLYQRERAVSEAIG